MIREFLLVTFSSLLTSVSLACSCSYSEEFNLLDYDTYDYIFEVKIESKYEFKKDTVKRNNPIPPAPSVYESGLLSGFNISMIEVFKGNLKLSESIMGFSDISSCSWIPKVGATYIFYTNSLNSVMACNRKLVKKYDNEKYQNEKSILRSLKTKPSKIIIKSNEQTLIEGSFVKEKREGIWEIYSMDEQNKIAFKLNYRNGLLISIEKENGYSEENDWHRLTYKYYDEEIEGKNEKTTTPKKTLHQLRFE